MTPLFLESTTQGNKRIHSTDNMDSTMCEVKCPDCQYHFICCVWTKDSLEGSIDSERIEY